MKYPKIKSATVAIAKVRDIDLRVFDIVGSGVCIDPAGIILTCQHVISAFMAKSIPEQVKGLPKSGEPQSLPAPQMVVPYAIFYKVDSKSRLLAFPCRVDQIISATDQDIGLIRVLPHTSFSDGYPAVETEDYSEIHEGLEVGTCGFPLGNILKEQIGAVTSSFTFGTISTISPYEGVSKEKVEAFQLDLTATHGNSGGPVFSKLTHKLIGVLQGGIRHISGNPQPGLVRCESAYKFLAGNEVEFLKNLKLGAQVDPQEMKKLGKKT